MEFEIDAGFAGNRLDRVLATLYPDFSRSRLQAWIKQGLLTIDGSKASASLKVRGGEKVCLAAVPVIDEVNIEPQAIPLQIVHEDEHLLVINKQTNLVMHPAAGNRDKTVQNGLLHYDPGLLHIPRAGIVHRLDKNTTGLFVVARTLKAHQSLVEQLQTRSMGRVYTALVHGEMVSGGTVDLPIGRHPRDRKRMAVNEKGKHAITHYRIAEKFEAHTALQVKLETGRTHQIRVHMAHFKHPLIGDTTYAGRPRFPAATSARAREFIGRFPRQALHAQSLTLQHPETGDTVSWQSDLPQDMQELMSMLRSTGESGTRPDQSDSDPDNRPNNHHPDS